MSTLREAIQYADQNPDSDFAQFLNQRIVSGEADQDAQNEGIDLTPIKEAFGGQTETSVLAPAPEIPAKPSLAQAIGSSSFGQKVDQITKEEVSKTAEKTVDSFENQGIAGKIAASGQLPLRAAATTGRIAGRIIAEPLSKVLEKIGTPIVNQLEKYAPGFSDEVANNVGKAVGVLESIKEKIPPDLYQSLADSVELASWYVGGKTVKPAIATLEKGAVRATEGVFGALEAGVQVGKKSVEALGSGVSKVGEITTAPLKKAVQVFEKLATEPIPKPVELSLKETSSVIFDKYTLTARKAALSNKASTPLELAGQKAQNALGTIQRKLNTIGEQKRTVLGKAAVGNKPVGSIVLKFRQELQNYLGRKTSIEGDAKLIRDISAEAQKLGANPSAKDVDKFIDFVQERVYTGQRDLTVPVTDQTTGAIRQMTGKLNENLKNQLPSSYRNLNDQYASMVDVRNELNIKLGKEGEKGGTLMKRVFSPSDARTKQLFEEVRKLTGIDLVNEATIARFVMETVGDARQANLLEQLQLPKLTKSGVLDFIYKTAAKQYNTPEAKFKRARELTMP